LAVERVLGRERRERWGPRTIDLDVLWIENVTHSEPDLLVPHPELLKRTFALDPLLELVDDARDPRSGELLSIARARLENESLAPLVRRPAIELHGSAKDVITMSALDRADALAAAARIVSDARNSHRGGRASASVRIECGDAVGVVAASWLREVAATVERERLKVTHVVVYQSEGSFVRGELWGRRLTERRAAERRVAVIEVRDDGD
jgi:hypothetical protein